MKNNKGGKEKNMLLVRREKLRITWAKLGSQASIMYRNDKTVYTQIDCQALLITHVVVYNQFIIKKKPDKHTRSV